jgi:hypothetical protein
MQAITLSPAALALFRLHLQERRTIDVDANRATYQELERAGLMIGGHGFSGRQVFSVTKEGFERKADLLTRAKAAG